MSGRIFWKIVVALGRGLAFTTAFLHADDAAGMAGAIFLWLVMDWVDRDNVPAPPPGEAP